MAQRKSALAQSEKATDDILFRTRYKGTPIRLELRDLTVQRLRQLKQWFGEPYGIPTELMRRMLLQECDGLTAAVWIGLQKAKKPVGDARDLDFNLEDDFEKLEDVQPEKADPPTAGDGQTTV